MTELVLILAGAMSGIRQVVPTGLTVNSHEIPPPVTPAGDWCAAFGAIPAGARDPIIPGGN